MAPSEHASVLEEGTTPVPETDEGEGPEGPDLPEAEAVSGGARGPLIMRSGRAAARARAQKIADGLAMDAIFRDAGLVLLGSDPVVETMALLREAVHLRVRMLKKVFEGRIERLSPARGTVSVPPPTLELLLATDEDRRPLRLDGAFAAALWRSDADVGDIVQIDKDEPIVSIRRDREKAEGRVQEERDFVYRLRLAEMDRTRSAHRVPLLGTGRLPPPSLDAMRETDQEVTERLTTKGTRLESGVLVILDAERLPEAALALVAASVTGPGAPVVFLQTEDETAFTAWRRRFEDAVVVDATD
ncbi:MAG: hypothetical protein KY455_02680 [Euryarchaeota archaeon]|nr:hypothetical protein [Euryarchaeota archaeon]